MPDDNPDPPRVKRTELVRARVTPAGKAEVARLVRLHGHADESDYLRALIAQDSRRNPA